MLELKMNSSLYPERTRNNIYAYNIMKSILENGSLSIDSIFDLCDIIQKQQKELEHLHKTLVKTQYIVATEETIERIKKEVEGC